MIEKNKDLTSLNTFHVPANARYFAEVSSVEELQETVSENNAQPIFVLGGGSNILFIGDFEGLVIHPTIQGIKIVEEDSKNLWLKVGAGENWHQLVRYCVEKGWGGIENLSLIPGSVGAAPIQNIGAYGVEFDQVFYSLNAFEIATGKTVVFTKEDCKFSYRNSIFKNEFKNRYVITDVTICLNKNPQINSSYGAIKEILDKKNIKEPSVLDISDTVIEIRNSKLPDPSLIPNAGSFFKNPIVSNAIFKAFKNDFPTMPYYPINENKTKIPAGWLIEKVGWKGRKMGKAGIYEKQALVIVNKGGATGNEILTLARQVQKSVVDMFGITLKPEVNIICKKNILEF